MSLDWLTVAACVLGAFFLGASCGAAHEHREWSVLFERLMKVMERRRPDDAADWWKGE